MKVLLANIPWHDRKHPENWGVRAGSRWPHFQKRPEKDQLPRYIPFPFFLAIAANMLKSAGHDVLLIDGVAEGICVDDFLNRTLKFKPDVFFAESSTPSLNYDLAVFKQVKDKLPGTVIISGGTHAADFVQEIIESEDIPDFWIAGEYEESLLSFINNNCNSSVSGLISKESSYNSLASVNDLNKLPKPLFEQLPVQNYLDPVCGLPAPNAQTWLSRGCPYGCTFCLWPQLIYGKRNYRTRDVSLALDEVEIMIQEYGCQSFYFDDDTTNIGEKRMLQLAAEIKKRKLDTYPWAMMARADCMSEKMLESFADAGIYAIKYGVESISPKLINACNKSTNLDKLYATLEKTRQLAIKTHLTFTFGLPGETEETINETLDFAIAANPESAQFSICTPFPGTEFYRDCVKHHWLINNDWNSFLGSGETVVVNTPSLDASTLKSAFIKAQKRWIEFLDNRLILRRKELSDNLKHALASSFSSWVLIGDIDESAFLWSDKTIKHSFGGDITTNVETYLQNNHTQDTIIAIISKHDEEKIYQKLKRSWRNIIANTKIIRLYN